MMTSVPPPLFPPPCWDSRRDTTPEPTLPAHQGYRLHSAAGQVTVQSSDAAGAYYAAQTLAQLQQQYPDGIPDLTIIDGPAIPIRAVMLDVSRDKVPSLASLELMLTRLGRLRYNRLILYLEHTFAHPGHAPVWQKASPYTAADIAQLTQLAATHHIELIAQQNALGHMERWLQHPRYADLAALPGGYRAPNGDSEPAACLEPRNPAAFALISELLSNVATAFASDTLHIGLDEPIDLNPAVWDAIFDVPGAPIPWAHVDNGAFCVPLPAERLADYVDWIVRVHQLPALANKHLLMWADVLAAHPEAIPHIPRTMTLVEWGYDADHPFEARVARLRQHGHTCWVAPGTAAWDSLAGRIPTMQANVDAAIAAALTHQLPGLVMCDWGNAGHFHHHPISWPGFVYAGLRSWHPHHSVDLTSALAHLVIPSLALASATVCIGSLDRHFATTVPHTGICARILAHPDIMPDLVEQGLTPAMLAAAHADIVAVIDACDNPPEQADAGQWANELRATAQWMLVAVASAQHRLRWPAVISQAEQAQLVSQLLDTYPELWLARNRVGGLADSQAKLRALVAHLLTSPEAHSPV